MAVCVCVAWAQLNQKGITKKVWVAPPLHGWEKCVDLCGGFGMFVCAWQ